MDYSVNYQKLQPKFKDCTFDSDKKPEYLRTWPRLLSGIVRNIPHGKQLENFLNNYLQRWLHEATTRPSFLQEAGLQLCDSQTEHSVLMPQALSNGFWSQSPNPNIFALNLERKNASFLLFALKI